ncbi:MAG: hypothetical protein J5930_08000 [Treponema sp.]|nr:hypothetical protein [Treponema sp.]
MKNDFKTVFRSFPFKRIWKILAAASIVLPLSAQSPQISTQPHTKAVTTIQPDSTGEAYFSAGEDGFVIKWSSDGMGEHYQISDLRITSMAVNPQNTQIASSETDGTSIHRLVVTDWASAEKLYTKQFKEPVSSVTYSAKGKFLFVTTNTVNGAYILNASNGKLLKKINDVPERISLIETGDTEKSAIMYCSTGAIAYYDLTAMKAIDNAHFSTEPLLEQVRLFGSGKMKNRFLAGIKNNKVYVIDAVNGKTLCSYAGQNILLSERGTSPKEGLYFASVDTGVTLYQITEKSLSDVVAGTSKKSTPVSVASISGIPGKKICSLALKSDFSAMFGTNDGQIYEARKENGSFTTSLLTKKMYEPILDITSSGDDIYLLTKTSLYKSSYDSKKITQVAVNSSQEQFLILSDGSIVLWTKNSKMAVQRVIPSDSGNSMPSTLFVPKSNIRQLHSYEKKLVYVLSNSKVGIYDIDKKKDTIVYTGVSVEDAILAGSSTLYVAKASSGEGDSAIVAVTITNGETVPLKTDGYASYALAADSDASKNIFGIALNDLNGISVTQVYQYIPDQRKSTVLFKYNQEDSNAFVKLSYPVLFSNLGKNQIYGYNLETNKVKMYRRTSSLPVKMAVTKDRSVFLNMDGGISWYNPNTQTPLAEWYLTTNGEWVEF